MMSEGYYAKWSSLYRAERRAFRAARKMPTGLVQDRLVKAWRRAAARVTEHENSFKGGRKEETLHG